MFIFFAALSALMALVIYFDATRFTIPNWLNALVVALYPFYIFMSPVPIDWMHGLMAFGIVLVLGFGVFAMKWMGGGDIKLLVATALWIGWADLLNYVLVVALIGGAFALGMYIVRKLVPYVVEYSEEDPLSRVLSEGAPLPYGLAIAATFLGFMWTGKIAGIVF